MITRLLKKLASRLPYRWQASLKRAHYARQIASGNFRSDEPETSILESLLKKGDWALDIGANVGHYTLEMSTIVGSEGRVIAFEPLQSTFSLLSANVDAASLTNVTLLNVAASSDTRTVSMDLPKFEDTGLANPYRAQISLNGNFTSVCIAVDSLDLPEKVALVKVDAEGHEHEVLLGMRNLLARSRPSLIIEGDDPQVQEFLYSMGYGHETLPGSWNRIYRFSKP